MDIPSIHIHTQSDKATLSYVTFMWSTMRSLANHPELLQLSVHCMGPTAADRLANLPATKTYHVPNVSADSNLMGSMGHGVCVEHALRLTDDGDIHIIVDSDTVVLARGWDDYVRHVLLSQRVGVIGTTYEDIGGFTSGDGPTQTYKHVPNTVWMAMSPLHRWRDLKARPQKESTVTIDNEGLSRTYGLPIGSQLLRDVGWQIPEYLHNRGITYEGWKQRKPSRDAIVLHGLNDYHEEYHVTDDNVPFLVHHRGSMSHPYRGNEMSQAFFNAVDIYLASERERPSRWTWHETPAVREAMELIRASKLASIARTNKLDTRPTIVDGIEGWLKATLDGQSVWSRYELPVPRQVPIKFSSGTTGRNLRLEGTVTAVELELPVANDCSYVMTVRNLTAGPARLSVAGGRTTLDVPGERCWLVLVDVDGLVHVE